MVTRYEITHGCEIKARNLQVFYDQHLALRAEELLIRGNVVALVGHNGAGKSTFIKAMLGLLNYTGEIGAWSFGQNNGAKLFPQEDMAFCPETGSVFADISVESYVKLWCRFKHGDGDYYKKAGSKYVELLSLPPLFRKLGRELSKGQRRRVQTAIGFLARPKLFFFDEPFDGLDVQKTNELTDIIQEHASEMSFIISSHRMDVMERLADTVAVLRGGEFISVGGVEKVCRDLCSKSYTISNLANPEETQLTLAQKFPELLVTRIGEQLAVAGHAIKLEQIENCVRSIDQNGISIGEGKPNLTDAMNYHLRGLAPNSH